VDLHAITPFAFLIILIALAFDYSNGWHDAANSIATIVSTRVLSPRAAVWWAAFFNFIAAFGFGTLVAKTIGKDVIDTAALVEAHALLPVVFAALLGAVVWNIVTWYFGLPSSSSHALIGGLCGAGIAAGGWNVLRWLGLRKILIFIVLSPTIGFVLGGFLMIALAWVFRRYPPLRVDRWFRIGQLFSAGLFSYSHGTNDAQKTMGIIYMVLVSCGALSAQAIKAGSIPWEVIILCHIAIAMGTASGGWRIVKTMGMKITKLKPVGGFAAETATGLVLMMNAIFGIPVSTTHVITGAILGVGSTRGARAVKWGIAQRIVVAWVLTIPAAGVMAFLVWQAMHLVGIA
jgi:PiT family inorganic phosphate transporter